MRKLPCIWYLSLVVMALWCFASQVAAQESKSGSQQLSLDALDSLGSKSTTSGNSKASEDFSLSQLDETGADSGSNALDEFTPQAWKDNLRFTVDLSYRPIFSGRTGTFGGLGYAGIDLHKVFTDKQGDWGTLLIQTYFGRLDFRSNAPISLNVFDDGNDFAIEHRITNFNYTRYGKGKTNFRIGHFEVPFGLEQIVNTNGTLRDFTHNQDFGLKSDWGVTFNGEASGIEYEVGLSRGSGNVWRRRHDPYIVAGRIGTSSTEPAVVGISAFLGDVLEFGPGGEIVQRGRVGADFTFADEKLVWLAELSAGFEDEDRAYTALLEVDWNDTKESLLAYNQVVLRGFGRDAGWDNELRNSLGLRWTPDTHWTISGQVSHFFDGLSPEGRGTVLEFQMRYRF